MADRATDLNAEQRVLRAAMRVLRPLVRFLLRHGIASDAFTELARKVYVDVADKEFAIEGKRQTVSRISVVTGLNRKEVARLRELPGPVADDELWRNRAQTVLSAWLTDPQFLDRKDHPLDLPFANSEPSFTDLVKKHSGDMQPRAVADELLRVGAVEETPSGFRMTRRGYEPTEDQQALIDMLGTDAAELLVTLDHNVHADASSRLLQGKVSYDNIHPDDVAEFLALSKRQARNLLEELNHWLAERDRGPLADNPEYSSEAPYTLGLGVYQIRIPTQENPNAGVETPAQPRKS